MPVATAKKLTPFARLYLTIVDDVLRAHAPLLDLVKVGNWITFEGDDPDPEKTAALDADMPELLVKPAGGLLFTRQTSDKYDFVRTFQIGVQMNDMRVVPLLELEWELARALKIHESAIQDLPFIEGDIVMVTPLQEDVTDDRRGVRGWLALIQLEITLRIDREQFHAEEPQI